MDLTNLLLVHSVIGRQVALFPGLRPDFILTARLDLGGGLGTRLIGRYIYMYRMIGRYIGKIETFVSMLVSTAFGMCTGKYNVVWFVLHPAVAESG